MGTLRRTCETVPQPSELRFAVVRAVGRGIAVLGGSTSCKGKGRFWGFLLPVSTMGNAIGSPTVKCFRFVCENFTTFPSDKRISLESSIRGLLGDIFSSRSTLASMRNKQKVTITRRLNKRTQQSFGRNMNIHE